MTTHRHPGRVNWAELEQVVRERYPVAARQRAVPALALELGVSLSSLHLCAGRLGLRRRKEPRWTPDQVRAVKVLIRRGLSDESIGKRLGRTAAAIKIIRTRYKIPGRRRVLLNMRKVAGILGLSCAKTVAWWIDEGWLPARRGQQAGLNRERWISRLNLMKFLRNRKYWHLWDPQRITVPELKAWALHRRRNERFHTVGEVARRFQCDHRLVNAWIHRGRLRAVKRGNWLIPDSALRKFVPFRVRRADPIFWTEEEDAFLYTAIEEGGSWDEISGWIRWLFGKERSPRACNGRYLNLFTQKTEREAAVV